MAKRGKLEIIKDLLIIVNDSHGRIKTTPLLRQTNLSTTRFKEYYQELINKGLIKEKNNDGKVVMITDKGIKFLEKYSTIVNFIKEFDL
ncbi:hypothetical protein COU61_03955 [Candidatus Pacearchaeota archaeon CG10_big_fil_rev_8_21_14_0_10_35_13]|nr:MAG: hypothetical protein COU61_03955 [Candidatus Pacearchaeota archaeon CG10_big_fil_rev_8_21_14_0_10_35_13]